MTSARISLARSAAVVSVEKYRIAGARSENNDSTELQMANSAAEDKWLGYVFHFNGCLNTGLDADLLERAPQRESVDHGSKHPHVIRRGAIHPAIRRRKTAPDISAADHHCHLDAEIAHLFDAFGNIAYHRRRNVVATAALLDGFAA